MITIEKLRTLPPKTMLRKILTLMEAWEREDTSLPVFPGKRSGDEYRSRVLRLLLDQGSFLTAAQQRAAEELAGLLEKTADGEGEERSPFFASKASLRLLHHLRYGIMDRLGIARADWDFYDEEDGLLTREAEKVLPIRLYLDDLRSPYNVGAIFRTAEAFGVEAVLISEHTASPNHKRALRTSMGCTEVLPWRLASLEDVSRGQAVFALELGGKSLEKFEFPPSGIAVIGSEELGISPEARRIAEKSAGIVSIPLRGAKASLNAATAAGILLHAWVQSISSP
jgi:TrmH family RNA methyltransferase